jgi:hypothetical protein
MKKLLIIAAFLGVVFGVNAQYNGKPNGNRHQENQRYERGRKPASHAINSFQEQARERIADGIVQGTINSKEAQRLLEFAERIEIKENRYLRNGRLTPNESRELEQDLTVLNRMISREKRDNDRQYVDNQRNEGRRRY